MINNGADIEARESESESTPLEEAAFFNHINCVKLLIEDYGAKVSSRNQFKITPLHQAAHAGNLEVVRQLTSYPDVKLTPRTRMVKQLSILPKKRIMKKSSAFWSLYQLVAPRQWPV